MKAELIMVIQIAADMALFVAAIFLLKAINRERKNEQNKPVSLDLDEFRELIDQSKESAKYLMEKVADGKKSLKAVADVLDEKEKKLKRVIAESRCLTEELSTYAIPDQSREREEKYHEVNRMIKQGLSEKNIASVLGLTEGEVRLVSGIDRRKKESA